MVLFCLVWLFFYFLFLFVCLVFLFLLLFLFDFVLHLIPCGRWYVMAILSVQKSADSDDQIKVKKENDSVKFFL